MNIGDVPPDFFRLYWLVWLVVGFGGMEYYAIKTGQTEGTFSYWVWWIIGTGEDGREWIRWLARIVLGVFFIWLIQHFYTGQNLFRKWFG